MSLKPNRGTTLLFATHITRLFAYGFLPVVLALYLAEAGLIEIQIGILTVQEVRLKRELASLGRSISINALENWEAKVSAYLEDLQVGIEELKNAAPLTKEERHEIFLFKKWIVNTLVSRVTIDKNRDLKVEIRMDLLDLGGEDPDQGDSTGVQVSKEGTYTRIPDMYPAAQLCLVL